MEFLMRGELARRARVNVETLRYYERRGLLSEPTRSASNYRLYDARTVRRLRFIKRAQELGFTLAEIRELLALKAGGGARCGDVRARAESRRADISRRIGTLRAMDAALFELIRACDRDGPLEECPILAALEPGQEQEQERERAR